jgi:hypothetical protein
MPQTNKAQQQAGHNMQSQTKSVFDFMNISDVSLIIITKGVRFRTASNAVVVVAVAVVCFEYFGV